jgi:hypothetical protein
MTRLELLQSLSQGMHKHSLAPIDILALTYATMRTIDANQISSSEKFCLRATQRHLTRLAELGYLHRHYPAGSCPPKPTTYTLSEKGKTFLLQIYADPQQPNTPKKPNPSPPKPTNTRQRKQQHPLPNLHRPTTQNYFAFFTDQ